MSKHYKSVDWVQIFEDIHSDNPALEHAAQERAVKALKGYAVNLAARKYPTFMSREGNDLIACAMAAVIENLPDYKPEKGAPTTFFSPFMEHAMLDWIGAITGFSIHYMTHKNKIKKVIEAEPNLSSKEVSKITGVPEKTIREVRDLQKASYKNSYEEIAANNYADKSTPEDSLLEKETNKTLYDWLDAVLSDMEKEILFDLFGLDGRERLNPFQVGKKYGIPKKEVIATKERVISKLANSDYKRTLTSDYQEPAHKNFVVLPVYELPNVDFSSLGLFFGEDYE